MEKLKMPGTTMEGRNTTKERTATVNSTYCQLEPLTDITHWTPPQNPTRQVAEHTPAQERCKHIKCTCHTLHRLTRIIVGILKLNIPQCASQGHLGASCEAIGRNMPPREDQPTI